MSAALHYEASDLAMFAMQLLDTDAHSAVAGHVRDCAFCRQELARMQGDLAACAYGIEMQSPPIAVRERVMRQVSREKKIVPIEQVERFARKEHLERTEHFEEPTLEFRTRSHRPVAESIRENLREDRLEKRSDSRILGNLFLWLGWATAIGFGIAGVRLYQSSEDLRVRLRTQTGQVDQLKADAGSSRRLLDTMTDSTAQQILLSGTSPGLDGAPSEGRVIYAADKSALIFLANNLGPIQPDKVYELWLIPENGQDPIPAGTFHPDTRGNGSVILPPLPRAIHAKAFGVTVEDGNGSQTPTMPIVLAGS